MNKVFTLEDKDDLIFLRAKKDRNYECMSIYEIRELRRLERKLKIMKKEEVKDLIKKIKEDKNEPKN